MRSGFFERWERISRAMRRNSAPSRKCPKAARHQTWDLCSREVVGLGGLEPPTSPLSGVRSSHLSYRPKKIDAHCFGKHHSGLLRKGSSQRDRLKISPPREDTSLRNSLSTQGAATSTSKPFKAWPHSPRLDYDSTASTESSTGSVAMGFFARVVVITTTLIRTNNVPRSVRRPS